MYKKFDLEKAKNGAKIALEVWSDLTTGELEYSYRKARILGYIRNACSIAFAFESKDGEQEGIEMANPDGKVLAGPCEYRLVIQEEERIPFTIKDYKQGDVVEKDGKLVTIFTTKADGSYPIVGQVECDERVHLWTEENAKKSLVIIR